MDVPQLALRATLSRPGEGFAHHFVLLFVLAFSHRLQPTLRLMNQTPSSWRWTNPRETSIPVWGPMPHPSV